MQKTITFLVIGAVIISALLCSCDAVGETEETTDNSEIVLAAIDKSSPVTDGNLITKTNTDSDGNINILYYDNSGNLVESFVWNKDSEIGHTVMKYTDAKKIQNEEELDASGNTIKSTVYQYDSDNAVVQTTVNEFKDGLLSKSISYNPEGDITGYSLSYYNDSSRLSKIERYTPDDVLSEYFMYEYNEAQVSKYSAFDANGNLKKYTEFSYNDNGMISEEKYYNADGELQNYYILSYYESGADKSKAYYDAEGNLISEDTFEDTTE